MKGSSKIGFSVLLVTTEWPTNEHPSHVPFLVSEVEHLRKFGVTVEIFYFRGSANALNYLRAFRRLHAILRINKFDLIHAQWGQSAIPTFFTKLPLVVTFRGSDLQGIADKNGKYTWKGRLLSLVSRWVANRADAIILVSESLSKFLPQNKRYTVVPSGVDLHLFKPMSSRASREVLGLDPGKYYVLFAGNPSRLEKRYPLAAEAVKLLNRHVEAKLFYAEKVTIDKMPFFMNSANVLLLTSLHEGSPNVVKEALACNIPVVSVDVGDVKQRISSIPGCYICRPDPEDIASALKKVLLNPITDFNGRDSVTDLDENILARKVIDVYRSIG